MGYPTFADQAHDLIRCEPADGALGEKLDLVRGKFDNLVDDLAPMVPNDANAAVAARAIHAACQAVVLAMIKEKTS